MKEDKEGVVNQGFVTSEEDVSSKNIHSGTVNGSNKNSTGEEADKENFRSAGDANKRQGPPLLPPLGNSMKRNSNSNASTENRRISFAGATEKSVQSVKMLPPGMGNTNSKEAGQYNSTYATYPNPNGGIIPQSVSHSPNENDESYQNKKNYFRDIRLSLDLTNLENEKHKTNNYINNRCSVCSNPNEKNYRTTGSDGDGDDHDHDHSDDFNDDSPNGECESCRRKVVDNYKIVFKYFVERPLFVFCVWAFFYIYWGDDALPGGPFFALTVLEVTALVLGYVAELLQMPGLLGMLAAGIILRNVPYIDVAKDLDSDVIGALRGISVVILLVRGGLGVNPPNIMKYKDVIPPLVIGSCALEALAGTLSVYFIIGFPIEWAALMGCIMSAMSGVAVVPYLGPTEKYLSVKCDPCTLSPNYQKVLGITRTACGLDAMIAICMAEVALGFIFAEGSVGGGFFKGIVEILIGGAFGIFWGFLVGFLLTEKSSHEKRVTTVFCCGVMSLIGLTKIGYPRGGPLATFAGVLLTATIWKKKQIGGNNNERLAASFTLSWYFLQPLLFSIIGTRTDFDLIDWDVVTKGLICLAISLSVRFIGSFLLTTWSNLTFKERIYLSVAWLPKGTVQAALGPVALDTALSSSNLASPNEYEDLAVKIMNMSAFTVIAAAIFGCICLKLIGPRLLSSHK